MPEPRRITVVLLFHAPILDLGVLGNASTALSVLQSDWDAPRNVDFDLQPCGMSMTGINIAGLRTVKVRRH